ncbi:MAG: hypothetical protein KAT43_03300 [Nanoarchaeota archaeon]|nr:hypothetical protein [Nanoarchaeota archaeon]
MDFPDGNGLKGNTARQDIIGRLYIAVSMTGAIEELFETLERTQPKLDALILAECGPNFLHPDRAEDFYRVKAGRASWWEKRKLRKELIAAREKVQRLAELHSRKYAVHLVFDNSDMRKEWNPSRLLYIGSRAIGSTEKTDIAVAVGADREKYLYQIAQEIVHTRMPASVLVCDFLADDEPGITYEDIPENSNPRILKRHEVKFASTGKHPTEARQQKEFVNDRLIHRVKLVVDPAYSSGGRDRLSIEKGGMGYPDGTIPTTHAGPMIFTEPGNQRDTSRSVEYASYVMLYLADNNIWRTRKNKLHKGKLREGDLQVNNELERALIHCEQLENEKYRAVKTAGRKRTWFFGITTLLGLAVGAVGIFTDAGDIAPEIEVLDDLGLAHLAMTQPVKPVADVDDVKYKEVLKDLEEAKKNFNARNIDYQSALREITKLKEDLANIKPDEETAEEIRKLESKLNTRDGVVRIVRTNIAKAEAKTAEYLAQNKEYKTKVTGLEGQLKDSKTQLENTELDLEKKEEQIKRYKEKGRYITEKEHEIYVKAIKERNQLREKLETEKKDHYKLLSIAQKTIKDAQKELILSGKALVSAAAEYKLTQLEIIKLEEKLQNAEAGESFAKYKARITADYETKMEDLRREKDEEIEAKIAQIENARDEALAVFNSPVDDYGPYLRTGLSTKQVAAHFDKGFARELEVAYGTQYRMFTVTRKDAKFLKIITATGRTEFRVLKDLSDYVQKRMEGVAKHLAGMDSRVDALLKGKSVTVTYTGKGLYADIYRTFYKKNPTSADLADFKKVVNAKLDIDAMEGLSELESGDQFELGSD